MGPITTGDIPDPHGLQQQIRAAYRAYVEYEDRLRVEHGMGKREVNYWE